MSPDYLSQGRVSSTFLADENLMKCPYSCEGIMPGKLKNDTDDDGEEDVDDTWEGV